MAYFYALVMVLIAGIFVIYGETDIHKGFAGLQLGLAFIILTINSLKDDD